MVMMVVVMMVMMLLTGMVLVIIAVICAAPRILATGQKRYVSVGANVFRFVLQSRRNTFLSARPSAAF